MPIPRACLPWCVGLWAIANLMVGTRNKRTGGEIALALILTRAILVCVISSGLFEASGFPTRRYHHSEIEAL